MFCDIVEVFLMAQMMVTKVKTILRGSYTRGGDYVTGDPCLLGCHVNSRSEERRVGKECSS